VAIRERVPEPAEPFLSEPVEELSRLRVRLETSLGPITFEFMPDRAPTHVRQFLRLASLGVYDGTTFHRVVPGFVIQGGHMPTRSEPLDERQQKYVRTLEPEFNETAHDRGIVSMARGDEPASATSSFFIVLARTTALDGKYTVFGRVVDGLDVVEKSEQVPLDGEAPVTPVQVTKVTVVRP